MRLSAFLAAVALAACATQTGSHPTDQLNRLPAQELSNCAAPLSTHIGSLDIAIAIDASRSTVDASGSDINKNGDVGKPELGRIGEIFDVGSTDPEDSFLHAQVRGAKSVIHGIARPDVRFSIIAFSGADARTQRMSSPRSKIPIRSEHAILESGLTSETSALDLALERVLESGSAGHSRFSAGMELANHSLIEGAPPRPTSRRVVLFMSDSAMPMLPGAVKFDPPMKDAALAAIDAGIVYHTFGLGEGAAAAVPHTLSRMARSTGGTFRPVPDAALLHCQLARALTP